MSLAAIALVVVALVGERSRRLTGIIAAMSFRMPLAMWIVADK